jgi:hypothetical protein
MQKRDYTVLEAGFIAGAYRDKGARVSLTERQAEYLRLAGTVEAVAVEAAPEGAPATAEPAAEETGRRRKAR